MSYVDDFNAPPQYDLQSPFDAQGYLGGLEKKYGIKAGETDLANLQGKNPEDVAGFQSALETQFQQRASSNGGGQQQQQYQTPAQQWNAQPSTQPQSDQLYQLLMQRAQQGTAVNGNDPNIRAQVDPVNAQRERASRNYLDDVAERSGPLANLQGERRLAAERTGQASGAFESEVIGREIAAKRDEIQQALSMYGSMLGQDKQIELQNQLAQLNAALQREGYGVQRQGLANQRYGMDQNNDQFLRELALREWQAGDQSAQGWAGLGA